jgi:hypothetical protein
MQLMSTRRPCKIIQPTSTPRVRLAGSNSRFLGYGMYMASTPNAVSGPEDTYTDVGPDVEFDRTVGRDVLSVRGTYLHESSTLNATYAAPPSARDAAGTPVWRMARDFVY